MEKSKRKRKALEFPKKIRKEIKNSESSEGIDFKSSFDQAEKNLNNLNSAAKIPKSEDVEFKINSDSGNNFLFDSSEIKKILNIRDLKELFDFVQIIRDGNCFYRAIAKGC